MAVCENCGARLEENEDVCPACGTIVLKLKEQKSEKPDGTALPQTPPDPADHTREYDREDTEKNKLLSCLSYLWILILFPIFEARDSLYVRFHRRQGLVLFVAEAVYTVNVFVSLGIAGMYFKGVPLLIIGALNYLGYGLFLYLSVKGISNVMKCRAKELPVIGRIAEFAGRKINKE